MILGYILLQVAGALLVVFLVNYFINYDERTTHYWLNIQRFPPPLSQTVGVRFKQVAYKARFYRQGIGNESEIMCHILHTDEEISQDDWKAQGLTDWCYIKNSDSML